MIRVLTVAGSDSAGGAGVQGDLRTLYALGAHGLCAVTAVTAQDSRGVRSWWPVPAEAVVAQMRAVLDDIGADAVKVGMLGSAAVAAAVADQLAGVGVPVVVDPVCASKHGDPLLDADALDVLRSRVLPLATVVTPNLDEVAVLTGTRVADAAGMAAAGEAVRALGPAWVLVKGGHLPAGDAVDVLVGPEPTVELRGPRSANPHTHGTGCALASALAAYLGGGSTVPEAARRAKEYVRGAIERGYPLGAGVGPVGH